MAWANFPLVTDVHFFLDLDDRHTTAKGRIGVACSSFISRLMDQFSFWAQRPLMIAAFSIGLCSKRTFSDVLDGVGP